MAMPTLLSTLQDYDFHLLTVIANRWDVDLPNPDEAAETLAATMLNPEKAAYEWSRLGESERGTLQMLLASRDHKMTLAQFARMYGELRQMGEDKRKREKPHLSPESSRTEILYYRGLVGVAYDQATTGAQLFVYVPPDLAAVLPSHQTGYDLSAPAEELELEADTEVTLLQKADTSLVDDITTLLAYLQLENVKRQGKSLSPFDRQALEDYLLGNHNPARIALMVSLSAGLGLAADNDEGFFKPVPAKARRWLDQARPLQIRALVETWQASALFNELEHIPQLILETASWQNDPTLLRQVIHKFLAFVPETDWFSVDEFVAMVKEREPDFQRPGADYSSWYIRDAETNQYIKGFENWERIEGAMLQVGLAGSLHWLGLADLGEGGRGTMLKLTAYGRAYAEKAEWLQTPDPETLLQVEEDGTLLASRKMSRYDRFQLARFTEWGVVGEPYEYHLTANSLTQAHGQGIKGEHIVAFLKRTTQENVPSSVLEMIEQWRKAGGAAVVLSHADILETDTETTLDNLFTMPEIRRFLGTRLGGRAVVVRPGQWSTLVKELHGRGILVEEET